MLRAAAEHFFRDGIASTGVDTVIADAGVAKMTLYGNFGSKDALVVAYLEDRDHRFTQLLEQELAARHDPLARALALVDVYRRYLDEAGWHGCAFLNAAAELPADHPGREVVLRHKHATWERWSQLLAELGAQEPGDLARECFFVLDGAFAHAGVGLGTERLDEAERFIRARLEPLADRTSADRR